MRHFSTQLCHATLAQVRHIRPRCAALDPGAPASLVTGVRSVEWLGGGEPLPSPKAAAVKEALGQKQSVAERGWERERGEGRGCQREEDGRMVSFASLFWALVLLKTIGQCETVSNFSH